MQIKHFTQDTLQLTLQGLFEAAGDVKGLKSAIASKIKDLPNDDATAKTLQEIEELLTHVNAGGRMGMINGELVKIQDAAVTASQKQLARYIASMEVSPADRAEMFSMWKNNQIVNLDKLMSKKPVTFKDIFNKYGENPAITELVDDVMMEAALGQGKGEFGLNVLSRSISKAGKLVVNDSDEEEQTEAKGDLLINYKGKWRKIEVKTTHGGAARFTDQEVGTVVGFEKAASDLNSFFKGRPDLMSTFYGNKGFPKNGLNLGNAVGAVQFLKGKDKTKFVALVRNCLDHIFGGKNASKKTKEGVDKIMTAVLSGNKNAALQAYAQTNFNYYMGQKEDEGVLAIDLNQKSFVYYSSAEDLTKAKLRFDSDTAFISGISDKRAPYPQISIVPTTFGADAAARAKAEYQKGVNPIPTIDLNKNGKKDKFEKEVTAWATDLCRRRDVTDAAVIKQVAQKAFDDLTKGIKTNLIVGRLTRAFPQLDLKARAGTIAEAIAVVDRR